MKTLKMLVAAVAAALMTFTAQAANTAKVVVADSGKTLKFVYDGGYYGTKDASWFSVAEAEGQSPTYNPPWHCKYETVTKVVFESSFAKYRPTHCGNWFGDFSKLVTVEGVENLDTSAATSLAYMFINCSSLKSLDASHFNTSNVTDMEYMFFGCSSLETIVAGAGFVTTAAYSSSGMFGGCTALVGGNGTPFSSGKTDKTYARVDRPGLAGYFTLERSAKAMVEDGGKTLRFVYDNRYLVDGTEGDAWFSVAKSEARDLARYNPTWYYGVHDDITKVVFDPSFSDYRPVNCGAWFYGFSNLETIEGMENFVTSSTTNMVYMFGCCPSLATIDATYFDTAKVTAMNSMFIGCLSLTTIYASDSFVTTATTSSMDMFYGCTSLVGGEGTAYSSGNPADRTYARIDGGASAPGYFTAGGSSEDDPVEPGGPELAFTLFDAYSAGAIGSKGVTYNGFLGDKELGGTFTLKVMKPKKGKAEASATLTKIDAATGKKVKTTGTVDVNTGLGAGGLAGLQLNARGVGGSLGGVPAQGAVDAAKAKDQDALAVMNGFNKRTYGLVLKDAAGEEAYLTVAFSAKGKAKVTGSYRGAKIMGSAQMSVGDRCAVPFVWSKKGVTVTFVLWFDKSSRELLGVTGTGTAMKIVDAGAADSLAAGPFKVVLKTEDIVASVSDPVLIVAPEMSVPFDGRKFSPGKPVKYTSTKGILKYDASKGDNYLNLKLSYSKGAIKGSFTIYSYAGDRLVKNKFTIAGVVVNGVGYASGTNKKLPAIPLVLAK